MPDDVRGTSIGYAINLTMDYGSGRQVTIAGTLPLNASLEEMNAELDKLRVATNRQSSLVIQRDVENTVTMARKTKASLELMLAAYDEEMEKEITRHSGASGPERSRIKAQIENMRTQALNNRLTKKDEIMRAQADIDKGEAILASIKKELEGS